MGASQIFMNEENQRNEIKENFKAISVIHEEVLQRAKEFGQNDFANYLERCYTLLQKVQAVDLANLTQEFLNSSCCGNDFL